MLSQWFYYIINALYSLGKENVQFGGIMEHLLYFQKLIAKLNAKYTVESINGFIKEYYSEILERQYTMDKESGIAINRMDFYLQLKEEYFEPKYSELDEKTFRRWRKNELKNGLPAKYFEIFQDFPATEELFNEYYLKKFSNAVMNQTDQMFLRTCYDLRGTRLLQIIDFILPILKAKDDMPIEEYLAEFKRAVWEYEVEQEYLDKHGFDDLPSHSFNGKSSSVLVPYKKVIEKKRADYILENKKQPNIMAEILEQNHFQIVLKNEK